MPAMPQSCLRFRLKMRFPKTTIPVEMSVMTPIDAISAWPEKPSCNVRA